MQFYTLCLMQEARHLKSQGQMVISKPWECQQCTLISFSYTCLCAMMVCWSSLSLDLVTTGLPGLLCGPGCHCWTQSAPLVQVLWGWEIPACTSPVFTLASHLIHPSKVDAPWQVASEHQKFLLGFFVWFGFLLLLFDCLFYWVHLYNITHGNN